MLCVSVDFRLWSVRDLMCVSLSECSLALEFFLPGRHDCQQFFATREISG